MKKVLLPICERDYEVTDKRFTHFIRSLSDSFHVEVMTIEKKTFEDIKERLGNAGNVSFTLIEMQSLPLTLDFRTNLVKVFVQYTYDLYIPHTDLKLWKAAAFDDFWGHISTYSFKKSFSIEADIVLLPLVSYDDTPYEEMDVFYTSLLFMAKEAGVKVAGYQLYPVFQGLKLMPLLMDAIVVKKEYERSYYLDMGVRPEKVHLLTDERDAYALSTIDDAYRNHMFNGQIPIGRNELAVVLYNHVKFRPQIREVINIIGSVGIPVVLSLVKRDYTVKDLKEDVIVKDFFYEAIQKAGCRFYLVEAPSTVPIIMVSDIVISPTYVTPVEFADRYNRKAVVYNPLSDAHAGIEGIGTLFINRPEDLASILTSAYEEKRAETGINDVLASILGDEHEA